jgi:GT2 family glycosyltransferase
MYNKSPGVIETIDKLFFPSLLNNASSNKQLIILDDASPAKKETEQLLEKYFQDFKKQFGDVKIIRNSPNLGFGPSYNEGIMNSEGDALVVTNDDVYFPKNSIDNLTNILAENTAHGLIGPITNEKTSFTYQYCKQAPNIQAYNQEEFQKIENFAEYASKLMKNKRIPADVITGFCFATPRDLIQELRGFDENFKFGLYEDTDLAKRVNQTHQVIIAPEVYVHHGGLKGASGSISQLPLKTAKAGIINHYKYGQKWGHWNALKHFVKGMYSMQTGKNTVSELFE